MEEAYLRSFALFFALFNPFLMSIYLLDSVSYTHLTLPTNREV